MSEIQSIVEFSENIANAEAPLPLPERAYPASITAATVEESQRGTKYAAVSFRVSAEDFPADYDANAYPEGKTIVYRRVPLEDNVPSRYRLKQFCSAIGAPMSKRIDVNEWIGLSASVTIKHEEYEGVQRETISKVETN